MDLEKYRRIQYVKDGNGFDGCDCFGLVDLLFKEEFNTSLPHYTDYKRIAETTEDIPIDSVQAKDILLFDRNDQLHTGVAIDKYKFIHCLQGHGVIISRIYSWQRKCIGVYRFIGK